MGVVIYFLTLFSNKKYFWNAKSPTIKSFGTDGNIYYIIAKFINTEQLESNSGSYIINTSSGS